MGCCDYRQKVLGCWLGKAVGGTLGQPWEGCDRALELDFYSPVPTGMMPNDDLDLQIVWACRLAADWQGVVSRDNFAKAWRENINFIWDEYGIVIRNLKMGIPAPWCGDYDNFFRDGLGAAIRSEIWACLAPGDPRLAAAFAFEDACLDHAGNGIYAEEFLAALESMAFVEKDMAKLLDAGLAVIPGDCRLAEAVRDAVKWTRDGESIPRLRERIIAKYGEYNFTDVSMNLAFVAAALIRGGGDFEKTICTAVNFGMDADCTGATAGSVMGILVGPEGIPARWLAPIGRDLILSKEIVGLTPPATLDGFTDLVVKLREQIKMVPAAGVEPDWSRFGVTFRRSSFSPWFIRDYRRFAPKTDPAGEIMRVPGHRFCVDFSQLAGNTVMLLETSFELDAPLHSRLMVNTSAACVVWLDGGFKFGREGGGMAPSFHRAPLNQACECELAAGRHTLVIGLAPATPEMSSAEVVFGISDENLQWQVLECKA
ncbi:MAG: ADP-ribosylglycohydrolase family protein [Victivallaceae bacterium]|nr:ADP-ribosylglycohydrolase family protein [Victivallaceae bacterium]